MFQLVKSAARTPAKATAFENVFVNTSVRGMATRGRKAKKENAAAADNSASGDIQGFSQMVQPKVQIFGLHARYANALFSVAAKDNKLEAVEKELLSISSMIKENKNFAGFLQNPTIPRHEKKASITGVMKDGKFSKSVAGLFHVLAENGRLGESDRVISRFGELMAAHRGEVQASVISADPLTSAQIKQVEKALGSYIQKDENLVLEAKVDPSILGGLQVKIGNSFIDLSLSTKINKINQLLAQPIA